MRLSTYLGQYATRSITLAPSTTTFALLKVVRKPTGITLFCSRIGKLESFFIPRMSLKTEDRKENVDKMTDAIDRMRRSLIKVHPPIIQSSKAIDEVDVDFYHHQPYVQSQSALARLAGHQVKTLTLTPILTFLPVIPHRHNSTNHVFYIKVQHERENAAKMKIALAYKVPDDLKGSIVRSQELEDVYVHRKELEDLKARKRSFLSARCDPNPYPNPNPKPYA